MNANITNDVIKNSRWPAAWTNRFCNSNMLKVANIRKARGATVGTLLRLLRDAFYRFLGYPGYNWRGLLPADYSVGVAARGFPGEPPSSF